MLETEWSILGDVGIKSFLYQITEKDIVAFSESSLFYAEWIIHMGNLILFAYIFSAGVIEKLAAARAASAQAYDIIYIWLTSP
jgi:hypothetical protein